MTKTDLSLLLSALSVLLALGLGVGLVLAAAIGFPLARTLP